MNLGQKTMGFRVFSDSIRTNTGTEPEQLSRYSDWLRAGRPRKSEFESR
jgi:hypothetical protein